MYATLDNSYDGIQVHCFELGWYSRGEVLPVEVAGIPKNCILATKYFFDENKDIDKYIYILIKNGIYINYFFRLDDIKGDFPIYEDIYYPILKSPKYNWLVPGKYNSMY